MKTQRKSEEVLPPVISLGRGQNAHAPQDPRYPVCLMKRLGNNAPAEINALGNLELLALPKTGLFCSAHCPGSAILSAYDQAAAWRDAGRCIIGGFHSSVEKECLRILLRGSQPIIICPARSLPKRVPAEWKIPLEQGRLLVLSGFSETHDRITAQLAARRNLMVAALSDEVWFAHIAPVSQTEKLADQIALWKIPIHRNGS